MLHCGGPRVFFVCFHRNGKWTETIHQVVNKLNAELLRENIQSCFSVLEHGFVKRFHAEVGRTIPSGNGRSSRNCIRDSEDAIVMLAVL